MKKYPYFLWAIAATVGLCLYGTIPKTEAKNNADKPVTKRQQQAIDPGSLYLDTVVNTANPAKTLDLSVPFSAHDNKWPFGFKKSTSEQPSRGSNVLFTSAPKPSRSPLQLKGGWIMSQEPEAEKRKSTEGAGIIIQLRQ